MIQIIQKIMLHTNEGAREYKILPTAAAFQAAADAEEIAVGEEVIYREYLVLVIEDFNMVILSYIGGFAQPPPQFTGAGGADWKMEFKRGDAS